MSSAKKSSSVALCGILTAVSLVIMLVSGLLGILTLAAPMVVGGLLIIPVKQYGAKVSLTMYAAVSLLSIILVTDKELALVYILFFGYYPIIQGYLDRLMNKAVRRIVKAVIFYAGIFLAVYIAHIIFSVPIFENGNNWVILSAIIYTVLAGLFFILYDKALRQFFTIYDIRLRPLVEKFIR